MQKHRDYIDLLSQRFEEKDIPKSSNTNPAKIVDFISDSNTLKISYKFEASCYVVMATDQTEADANIDDETKRKKYAASETGTWQRGDGTKDLYARAVSDVDLSPGVQLEIFYQPASGTL